MFEIAIVRFLVRHISVNGGAKVAGNPGTNAAAGLTMGAFGSAVVTALMNCRIATFFATNQVLDDGTRAKVLAYLKAYYAL